MMNKKAYVLVKPDWSGGDIAAILNDGDATLCDAKEIQEEINEAATECEDDGENFNEEWVVYEATFTKLNVKPTKATRTVVTEVTGYGVDLNNIDTTNTVEVSMAKGGLTFSIDD